MARPRRKLCSAGTSTRPFDYRKELHSARIAENIDIFDFTLTADDIAAVDVQDAGMRSGSDPEVANADTFSFKIEA